MRRQRSEEKYLQLIDFIFSNEDLLREGIIEARATRPPVCEIRNESYLSDPTAAAAIDNITPVEEIYIGKHRLFNPEMWLEVLERTYAYLKLQSSDSESAVRKFYRGQHYLRICYENNFSVEKLYRTLNQARVRASLLAASRRLIKVE